MHPHTENGGSLYPVAHPDYDSDAHIKVSTNADMKKALKKKTAFKYDDDSGEFKRRPIHHWKLDTNAGQMKIPAGYEIPDDFNPLGSH